MESEDSKVTKAEELEAKRAAREFATRLRTENWAEFVPEEWNSMTDIQIALAIQTLRANPRIHQRKDMRWEKA